MLQFVCNDGNPGGNKRECVAAPHAPYVSMSKGVQHHPSIVLAAGPAKIPAE